MAETLADFPAKLRPLFEPHRYKTLHGGRGGAKSWGVARALLIQAAARPMRVLCTREVQKSIRDSVHRLLGDQIEALGLGASYEVLDNEIRGRNGSLFLFAGLATQTVESIKSYEGVDVVWVEEGQRVRKRSWDVLIPTIRKPGSEIWTTLNPDLDTDDTYVRLIERPAPDSVVVKIGWQDNPWFPAVLEQERLHAKATMTPEDYENIWEGAPRAAAEGAIYAGEIAAAQMDGRVANVPYDPLLKVHVVFDLGWNDAMSISLVQKLRSEIRVIANIEDSHRTLDSYSAQLREMRMNWGAAWLPHDGEHRDYKSGKSSAEIMQALGWDVRIVPKLPVEEGIKLARQRFGQVVFDRTRAARLVECLKRYRRAINQQTQEPQGPLHDEFSHGADNFRYVCVSADSMTNDDRAELVYEPIGIV